ncbi:FtsK/SpoIIIE protein [Bacillus phage Mater]|uniref:FtsK/SpoIIIE protein n=1 Tax=Bacillus phage Mater TaxID=1540090 RepID=A0A0A0RUH6_9CAUD|nr:FtsK/SpoIIIE-like protein [Bacillus phage Mater]AIW03213.1 FtsK/SpoIIIE protein [Bacillus phage Mater]
MIKIKRNHQNVANFFVQTEEVKEPIGQILAQSTYDGVFGFELSLYEDHMKTMVMSPAYIRLSEERSADSYRDIPTSEFKAYEGYLLEPFIFPLKEGHMGSVLEELENMYLREGEMVLVQWLFRKTNEWRDKAFNMYESYLNGNDRPAASGIGRKFQDKMLGALGRIHPIGPNEFLIPAEEKICGNGYQFQLRIAIKSERTEEIKTEIEDMLSQHDSYNSIRLAKSLDKKFTSLYEDCILSYYAKDQIMSEGEFASVIGTKAAAAPVKTMTPVADMGKALQFLPVYPRKEIEPDEAWFGKIANALKRVKLISEARLYDKQITAGVRLTVIQSKIPSETNITNIQRKMMDIRAVLGIPSINIEQGNGPETVQFVIPNDKPTIISLRELLDSDEFSTFAAENDLAFAIGVDEINQPLYLSLTKLVHLLVAGTTGSGKSVFLNALIVSLLVTHTPDQLQFIMIDPKSVELQQYRDFPHVRTVITNTDEAYSVLERLVDDMETRYSMFVEAGVRDITVYNKKVEEKMPYIVCVIDEFADLMDTNSEVEGLVARLAQKARAAGIHLVIATQRPSVDIISGRIKAVLPNAISFNLKSNTNYKTVFGKGLPDGLKLLGKGDGIAAIEGASKEFQRFQSPMVSPDEVIEADVYENLIEYYKGNTVAIEAPSEDIVEVVEEIREEVVSEEVIEVEEETLLDRAKKIIATTKETRITKVRGLLEVKQDTVAELFEQLIEEGWLLKHKSKSKGYELIATEEMMNKYLNE